MAYQIGDNTSSATNQNNALETPLTAIVLPPSPNISSPFQSLAPLTMKLDRANYAYWKSQVHSALRSHDLEGYILGTKICPLSLLITP